MRSFLNLHHNLIPHLKEDCDRVGRQRGVANCSGRESQRDSPGDRGGCGLHLTPALEGPTEDSPSVNLVLLLYLT